MITEPAIRSLKQLFPGDALFTDPADLVTYEFDAGLDRGMPDGIVFVRSTEELVALVRWADEYNIPLVARGAGTGLSGGAVAERGGIVVEFSRMCRIIDLDVKGRRVRVEPGVANIAVDELARQAGLYFPPDPSSQRASTIGGNVAENAGGPHCFKYGVTTNYVQRMDVVLADGKRVQIGGAAVDYPEYDLGGLITGSEGTLALIGSVDLRLVRNPPGVKTMMAVFDTLEQSGAAVSAIIAAGLVPATMELLDRNFARIIEEHAHAGIPTDAGAVFIVEVDGYPAGLDLQIQEIAALLKQHGTRELRIARDAAERDKIWYARKSAAGALSRMTPAYYMVDTTVPRSRLAETIAESNQICAAAGVPVAYAFHAGDGNLHPVLLIMHPGDRELHERVHRVARDVIALAVRKQGSLTGEHGVGIEKREYMPMMHTRAELAAMLAIKNVFDPHARFNPGKIFPPGLEHDPNAGIPASTQIGTEYAPETADQAADMLAGLSAARRSVCIMACSQGAPADLVRLSTRSLAGIKTYAPDDLYVTAGSGTLLSDLESFLARDRKQVPLASPWPQATLGGLIAANVNSPLSIRYGRLRDLVLAMTVVLADGRVIGAGRPVIKNVAGYDLPKVFVGSYGTLGLIADVTLKLTPLPRARRSLLVRATSLTRLLEYASHVMPLALVASAIVLYEDGADYVLAYSAEGLAEDVEAELEQVCAALNMAGAPEPKDVDTPTGTETWSRRLQQGGDSSLLVRAGLAFNDLASFLQRQAAMLDTSTWIVDLASSLLYLRKDYDNIEAAQAGLENLRHLVVPAGGYAVAMQAPELWSTSIDLWGLRPKTLDLMRRLKQAWDPANLFRSPMFRPLLDSE